MCLCLFWKKKKKKEASIDFSHFTPTDPICLNLCNQEGFFSSWTAAIFSIDYSCLIIRKSNIYSSVDTRVVFFSHFVPVRPALTGFLTSAAVPDVAALWLSLQLSAAVEKVITEMDDGLMIFNGVCEKNVGNLSAVNLQIIFFIYSNIYNNFNFSQNESK